MKQDKIKKVKEKILNKLEGGEREFEKLYKIYLKVWNKTHEEGNPVCYKEWVDNEFEALRIAYRRYLKEAVLDDENFDETSTEDFLDFCRRRNKKSYLVILNKLNKQ